MFIREKQKMGDEIARKVGRHLEGRPVKEGNEDDLMEEFYKFCKDKLPKDHNYKESIMFVSLFYYFMEKKNLLKK